MIGESTEWRAGVSRPSLGALDVHVWRIRLDSSWRHDVGLMLSAAEQARAGGFHFHEHRRAFVIAHAALRRILAGYLDAEPAALDFVTGAFGKPRLARQDDALEFNLSHSGDLALVAVARRSVGIDVERWDPRVEALDLARHFFSPAERDALSTLGPGKDAVLAGFFAAWSRKEAYLKAGGHGITRGLDHFDVSLAPGEPARLLADRLEVDAPRRWTMHSLDAGAGYSAALVVDGPMENLTLLEAEAP